MFWSKMLLTGIERGFSKEAQENSLMKAMGEELGTRPVQANGNENKKGL
jgi:hypothetical protein